MLFAYKLKVVHDNRCNVIYIKIKHKGAKGKSWIKSCFAQESMMPAGVLTIRSI